MNKVLYALQELGDYRIDCQHYYDLRIRDTGDYLIVETALKALEIIKNVCPNIFCVMRTETYEEYKSVCHDDTLLENEYELLKKVLL